LRGKRFFINKMARQGGMIEINEEEFLRIIGEGWLEIDKLQKELKNNFLHNQKIEKIINELDSKNRAGFINSSLLRKRLGLDLASNEKARRDD
jgi:hypothetical protein